MPAAGRDPAQLLDVDVDQLTRGIPFVAADHPAGGPIHPGQAMQLVAAEDRVAGGPRPTGDPGQAVGPQFPFPAKLQDLLLDGSSEPSRASVWPGGPIRPT